MAQKMRSGLAYKGRMQGIDENLKWHELFKHEEKRNEFKVQKWRLSSQLCQGHQQLWSEKLIILHIYHLQAGVSSV